MSESEQQLSFSRQPNLSFSRQLQNLSLLRQHQLSLSRQQMLAVLSNDIVAAQAAIAVLLTNDMSSSRRNRRYAVNPVNRRRSQQGYFHNLVNEMRLTDTTSFYNFHRMTPAVFDELLTIVGCFIQPMMLSDRVISASERLSLTLRYLASGDSMISIGRYGYRVGQTTMSQIIRQTCYILWDKLKLICFPQPTSEMWLSISRDFYERWNFPNCLGAMDGKHVIIQAFGNSGSVYRNYKHSHSVILFAVCDANYKFIMVDIGASGHKGDSTIFRTSDFGKALMNGGNELRLPPPACLPNTSDTVPHVFVGDEAFPLLVNLMRPYPGRNTRVLPQAQNVFNYRLSRARRVVENAFGILAAKWRIYRRPILASKPTVLNIIKATVVLHNWLRDNASSNYMSTDLVDSDVGGNLRPGAWRSQGNAQGMQEIGRVGSNNSSRTASDVREKFKYYFNSTDRLPWQESSLH